MRKFDWLEYGIEVDRIFCKPSRHFDNNRYHRNFNGPFSGIGVNDWKKLGEELCKHDSSGSHRIALRKSKDYKCTKLALGGSVVEMCDEYHHEIKAPVNDILVSAPEIASSKTRAGGSLSLCHYFIASSYVIYSGCRLYKHP